MPTVTDLTDKLPTCQTERYELIKLIGEGAFSKVYFGVDSENGEIIALKICKDPLLHSSKFMCGVRVLRELSGKGPFPEYRDGVVVSPDDRPAVAMSWIEGKTLTNLVHRGGDKFDDRQKLKIMHQICGAYSILHSLGYVHADAKSENVVLTPSVEAKILDFDLSFRGEVQKEAGLFVLADPILRSIKSRVGCTLAYAPPELFSTCEPPLRTQFMDVWGIGCMGYLMWMRTLPFKRKDDTETVANICAPLYEPEYKKDLDPKIKDLLRSALNKTWHQRPSALDLKEMIEDYMVKAGWDWR